MSFDANRPQEETARVFTDFVRTVQQLRDPVSGCPWDLKQTFVSLRRYMIEEAYEAAAAMNSGRVDEIVDELGDVLLQVVLNAQLGRDEGKFSLYDVIDAINSKMIRRHPHVFAAPNKDIESPEDVKRQWQIIKDEEKKAKGEGTDSLFSDLGGEGFPASTHANKIGKRAATIDFDFKDVDEVVAQFRSEVDELVSELAKPRRNDRAVADELGDLYFSLAQVCRHLGQDSETVAAAGNQKFLKRFRSMESIAAARGEDLQAVSRDTKEALWQAAKASQLDP